MAAETAKMPKMPPKNEEAERAVLGSILRDNLMFDDVLPMNADEFYADAHRKIWEAVTHLIRAGKPADLVTLAEVLHARRQVEDIGGYGYLSELWDGSPTGANARYYADIVREMATLRRLSHECLAIHDAVCSREPSADLVERAERAVFAASLGSASKRLASASDVVAAASDMIDSRAERRRDDDVTTGFQSLDQILGYLQAGSLTFVAARPSVGKSAFAQSIIQSHVFDRGAAALFVSLEMDRAELGERLIAAVARLPMHTLRMPQDLSFAEKRRMREAIEVIRGSKMFIADEPRQTIPHIATTARRLCIREKISLVVVDYLQLVEPDERRLPRHEQVATMSRSLKLLARELRIPIIVLAQLNREKSDDGKPKIDQLRESGACEQDADVILLLSRSTANNQLPSDPVQTVIVDVGKQRNGPTGEVSLRHFRAEMRFEEMASRSSFHQDHSP